MHPATPLISTIWSSTKLWKKNLSGFHNRLRKAGALRWPDTMDSRSLWSISPSDWSPQQKQKSRFLRWRQICVPSLGWGWWVLQFCFGDKYWNKQTWPCEVCFRVGCHQQDGGGMWWTDTRRPSTRCRMSLHACMGCSWSWPFSQHSGGRGVSSLPLSLSLFFSLFPKSLGL